MARSIIELLMFIISSLYFIFQLADFAENIVAQQNQQGGTCEAFERTRTHAWESSLGSQHGILALSMSSL